MRSAEVRADTNRVDALVAGLGNAASRRARIGASPDPPARYSTGFGVADGSATNEPYGPDNSRLSPGWMLSAIQTEWPSSTTLVTSRLIRPSPRGALAIE